MKMIRCVFCFFPRILPKFLPCWLNQQNKNGKDIASFNISCPVSRPGHREDGGTLGKGPADAGTGGEESVSNL